MGILDTLIKHQEQPKDHGVCIPEHVLDPQKRKISRATPGSTSTVGESSKYSPASFRVEGTYEIKKCVTISGTVIWGSLSKESKLLFEQDHIPIIEITQNGKIVERLENGETGAITIEPDVYLNIRTNTTLEFE
ncbi:MAG: hypothetical protein NUV67_00175 [archaeon]|nr:hypothetical protein [archaeon]